jgi:hypothetical protein
VNVAATVVQTAQVGFSLFFPLFLGVGFPHSLFAEILSDLYNLVIRSSLNSFHVDLNFKYGEVLNTSEAMCSCASSLLLILMLYSSE